MEQEQVPPSINVDLASDVEPTRSCDACGGFLGQNSLVRRGLIPNRLGGYSNPTTNATIRYSTAKL